MKSLYYISAYDFSISNAAILRIKNVCKCLIDNLQISIFGSGNRPIYEEDSIKFISETRTNPFFLKRVFLYFAYPIRQIKNIKKVGNPDYLVCYGLYGFSLYILSLYCKKNNIKILYDAVEWYNYSHFPGSYLNPTVWQIHWTMKSLLLKMDGILCISTYLYNYYSLRGKKCFFIPPVMEQPEDATNIDSFKYPFDNQFINLIYAGSFVKKDLIGEVIKGVEYLSSIGKKIRFYIIGSNVGQVEQALCESIDKECIFCLGRMPREEVLKYIKHADCSVILRRKDDRYAKAGFSTKFVESFSLGLPVAANLTGDIGNYLINGFNGIVIEGENDIAVVDAFKNFEKDDKMKLLRENALQTFEEHFRTDCYSYSLKNFLFNL